jgi:hypothetical protein
MSPYSTEGTPVMTSTDSTLLDAMLFVLTPLTPEAELFTDVKLALFDSLTPSTSTAVPNEELPVSDPAIPARMSKV